jgi:hypothetical protein
MKLCRKCGEEKPIERFARCARRGRQSKCKACDAAYRIDNRARVSATKQAWAERNPERAAEIKRNHFIANKQACLTRMAEWKRAHPECRTADNLSRRLTHKNATPQWANEFFIAEAYDLARERTTGQTCAVDWSVDHEIPLRNPLVCGLHTHQNLRVIPALDNVRKGNRFVCN